MIVEPQDAHVWDWWRHNNPEPARKWTRMICSRCGATTVKEASQKCQPWGMPSGEYECPGTADEEAPEWFGYLWERSSEWQDWHGLFWAEVAIAEGLATREEAYA